MTKSHLSNRTSQIFLVGFMASGKSTIGPLLAAKLNRPFVDLDPLIEAEANCTIADLITREGEDRFRQIETETLREAAHGEPAVIAPGGGAILRAENRELMSNYGVTIWLDTPFEVCWQRIRKDQVVRPLAPNEESARTRYEQRLPLYRLATIQIRSKGDQTPEEIVEEIIKRR